MNEAREKTVEQIFAEQRKLWETGNALYPHKDTLRLGYDAGYDSRDAEVEALRDALEHYADKRHWISDRSCWNGDCVYHPIDKPDGTHGYTVARTALDKLK